MVLLRKKWWRAFFCSCGLLFFLFSFSATAYYLFVWNSFGWRHQWLSFGQGASRVLLCAAMPVMAWVDQEEDVRPGPLTSSVLKLLAPLQLDIDRPASVLRLSWPYLAQLEPPAEQAAQAEQEQEAPPAFSPPALPAQPAEVLRSALTPDSLVIIYHTHTGETYRLTDGVDRLDGKCGGVVQAGAAVKEILEAKYRLKVAHAEKVHDAEYDISYRESEKTLRRLLAEHPNAKVVLDIHRDAGRKRENSLVKVNGQEVAPILLVVGSDARLPFPTWEKNYQFASKLAARLNEEYPGLCLGVRVKDGRYNQFLHPRAVLVEVGSVNNSTAEAVASARLFGDVLGAMMMEIIRTGE